MRVGAWLGRLLLLALATLCLVGPPVSVAENPLVVASWLLGGAFLGFLVQSFRRTERLGGRTAWLLLWATFTYTAIVAFVDPATVIADSQQSRKGPDLTSNAGAYVAGAFLLVIANMLPALALWGRWTTRRRLRAD